MVTADDWKPDASPLSNPSAVKIAPPDSICMPVESAGEAGKSAVRRKSEPTAQVECGEEDRQRPGQHHPAGVSALPA